MTLAIPDVKASPCRCSFCWLIFYIKEELTDDDKAKFAKHLSVAHGLKPFDCIPV